MAVHLGLLHGFPAVFFHLFNLSCLNIRRFNKLQLVDNKFLTYAVPCTLNTVFSRV